MEQDLKIIEVGKKDKNGNDIKNINLKTRVNKATGEVTQGLTVGNHIIVTKIFAEGYENKGASYSSFSCKARYKGEEVSFWLSQKEHDQYKEVGGIDDDIKVTLVSYEYTFNNVKKTATKLVFDLV